jgi:hypothetical protein
VRNFLSAKSFSVAPLYRGPAISCAARSSHNADSHVVCVHLARPPFELRPDFPTEIHDDLVVGPARSTHGEQFAIDMLVPDF